MVPLPSQIDGLTDGFTWDIALIGLSKILTRSLIYIQWMVTSILEDQQYMFGVRSLLKVEKVLLMKNVLTMKPAISSQHLFSARQF